MFFGEFFFVRFSYDLIKYSIPVQKSDILVTVYEKKKCYLMSNASPHAF